MAEAFAEPDNSSFDVTTETMPMMQASKPYIGWEKAAEEWGKFWDIYTYTATGVNAFIIIWTIANLIYISVRGRTLVSRKYFFTLNLMVLIFAITKFLFYAIDPKGINGIMPELAGNLLLNSSFPTLTVGFAMLYVALRQCTVPNRHLLPLLLKTKYITLFIVLCFTVSYATDVLVAHFHSMQLMIAICQLFYTIWGLTFFGLYTALVAKYRQAVRRTKKKMKKTCYRNGHCRRGFDQRNLKGMPVCVNITFVAALLFLLLALSNIYLVFIELSMLTTKSTDSAIADMCDSYRQTWTFLKVHIGFTSIEHLMAIMLAIAGTQPLKCFRISAVTIAPDRILLQMPTISNANVYSIEQDIDTSFTDLTSVHSQQTVSSAAVLDSEHSISSKPT